MTSIVHKILVNVLHDVLDNLYIGQMLYATKARQFQHNNNKQNIKVKCDKEEHKRFGNPNRCNVTYIWRHSCQEKKFTFNSISSKSYVNNPNSPSSHLITTRKYLSKTH